MKQLTGKTVHWEQAQMMLENKFVKSQKKTLPIILIVDEVSLSTILLILSSFTNSLLL